jgi:hypothetical protein
MECVNLNNINDTNFQYGKPTLWDYGGHPHLPSSSEIFDKMQELLSFTTDVWPRKNLLNIELDGIFFEHVF